MSRECRVFPSIISTAENHCNLYTHLQIIRNILSRENTKENEAQSMNYSQKVFAIEQEISFQFRFRNEYKIWKYQNRYIKINEDNHLGGEQKFWKNLFSAIFQTYFSSNIFVLNFINYTTFFSFLQRRGKRLAIFSRSSRRKNFNSLTIPSFPSSILPKEFYYIGYTTFFHSFYKGGISVHRLYYFLSLFSFDSSPSTEGILIHQSYYFLPVLLPLYSEGIIIH